MSSTLCHGFSVFDISLQRRFYTLRVIHKMSEDSLRPSGNAYLHHAVYAVAIKVLPTVLYTFDPMFWCPVSNGKSAVSNC